MSDLLTPKTPSEIAAYEAGVKYKAEREPHRIGSFDTLETDFKNPYKRLTMEFYYFNHGYLGTKYEIKEVKNV